MRKVLVAGNWKMYHSPQETVAFFNDLDHCRLPLGHRDLLICPPFISLAAAIQCVAGTAINIGAQNMHWADHGAYTGEVSPTMLHSIGCSWVIIGHSERRALFHEDDELLNRKLAAALAHDMTPVFCIGETLEQRTSGGTLEVLKMQLDKGLKGIAADRVTSLVLAYEPVWAIGTGQTATPQIAQEAHNFIRCYLDMILGPGIAQSIRILYGGSVKPDNAADLIKKEDIDGFLIGGASLKPESFAVIACAGWT